MDAVGRSGVVSPGIGGFFRPRGRGMERRGDGSVPKPKSGKNPGPQRDVSRAGAGGAPGGVRLPWRASTSVPPDGSPPPSGPARRRRSSPPLPSRPPPVCPLAGRPVPPGPVPAPCGPSPPAPGPGCPRRRSRPVRPRAAPSRAGARAGARAGRSPRADPRPVSARKNPLPRAGAGGRIDADGIGPGFTPPSRPALRHPSRSQTPPTS